MVAEVDRVAAAGRLAVLASLVVALASLVAVDVEVEVEVEWVAVEVGRPLSERLS